MCPFGTCTGCCRCRFTAKAGLLAGRCRSVAGLFSCYVSMVHGPNQSSQNSPPHCQGNTCHVCQRTFLLYLWYDLIYYYRNRIHLNTLQGLAHAKKSGTFCYVCFPQPRMVWRITHVLRGTPIGMFATFGSRNWLFQSVQSFISFCPYRKGSCPYHNLRKIWSCLRFGELLRI